MQLINLVSIFITGLVAGGLTCMAVQGGLLASAIAQRESESLKKNDKNHLHVLPILAFLGAKLIAYTALGFLLGWVGSLFQLSLSMQFLLQMGVAVFMIGTALNILDVHPMFRYFAVQPPHAVARLVRRQSKQRALFAPAILGAFTVFIPCGTTQAMMALAIASGSPIAGAVTMFTFVLGTVPVFFTLGYFMMKVTDIQEGRFMKIAAVAIIILALFNLNNALGLAGAGIPIGRQGPTNSVTTPASTTATIAITSRGYSPETIVLKTDSDITLTITNADIVTCAAAFTIPRYGIQKVIRPGTSETVQFRTPAQPTTIPFMCSMGMYRGEFIVTQD